MNIGIFDSGIGGLNILKKIREEYSSFDYIYVADQTHIPYGLKSKEEVKSFSENITNYLINKRCKIIIIACNTATSASLEYLRNKFPDIFFIGIEPALKPAVSISETDKIGILATQTTLKGNFYNSLVEKFGKQAELFEDSCIGLVEEIEKGDFNSSKIQNILKESLQPMIDKNIDSVVLGCTHYPFVKNEIQNIVGKKVAIIDPTNAVVKQFGRILDKNFSKVDLFQKGKLEIYTTGDKNKMYDFLNKIINDNIKVGTLF